MRRVQDLRTCKGFLPLVFETSAIPLGEPSVVFIYHFWHFYQKMLYFIMAYRLSVRTASFQATKRDQLRVGSQMIENLIKCIISIPLIALYYFRHYYCGDYGLHKLMYHKLSDYGLVNSCLYLTGLR